MPSRSKSGMCNFLLQGSAYDWWKLVLRSPRLLDPIPWEFFVQEFKPKYVFDMYKERKWKQFLNLKQRNLSVAEYEKEFSHLSKVRTRISPHRGISV